MQTPSHRQPTDLAVQLLSDLTSALQLVIALDIHSEHNTLTRDALCWAAGVRLSMLSVTGILNAVEQATHTRRQRYRFPWFAPLWRQVILQVRRRRYVQTLSSRGVATENT